MLMHIGVHKTGTTAVQDALANCRPILGQWQVRYPGSHQAHRDVASSAMGVKLGFRTDGVRPPKPGLWEKFVENAAKYDGVTVFSSEFLAQSSTDVARQIVGAVGPEHLHVAITLRNLGRILPSAWQQNLKSGYETGYADWLVRVLTMSPEEGKTTTFWSRHRHDIVVERWAEIVGPDHVSVVVVDDSDRRAVYSHFEDLLALPRDTLFDRRVAANRSMTLAEAELLRRINTTLGGARGWRAYSHHAHDGLIKGIVESREPTSDEVKLQTPQWALDIAADKANEMVDRVAASGVRILGDTSVLRARQSGPEVVVNDPVDAVPLDAAVSAILGGLRTGRTDAAPEGAASSAKRGLLARMKRT
jgi:hypothetical protein